MPRIQANRDSIDDRFSVLGFTVRTESPLFEVAVATDPQLFLPENRGRRARANFYSSRAQGVIRARRGEAVYLLPPEVLGNFIGQPRLYFGLATYRESTRGAPDFVQAPSDGSMYIGIGQLTERGLRRSGVSLPGSSYGRSNGHDPSLDWGGDMLRTEASHAAAPAAPPGQTGATPKTAAAATPVTAAGYDDGFGAFPEPEAAAAEGQPVVSAQEVLLRSYDGTLLSQLSLFAETAQWIAGVSDTRALPHSAICHLLLYNAQGLRGRATGFCIGPQLLMTNAHVVHGTTRMVVIPGKNGAGTDTPHEPFGRFSVDLTPSMARPHPNYDATTRARAFDMALVKLPTAVPSGRWLAPVEELTQSRPEGVAVCGYSAHSRRGDLVAAIVHATLDPEKQHLHRGYVRTVDDDSFSYDVQELAGSSGSPVYWIEGGARPRVHVVGINAGPRNETTNEGCRITPAKRQWIQSVATEWGLGNLSSAQESSSDALAIPLDPGVGGRSIGTSALEPADVIVSTTRAFVSRLIRLGTTSPVSHVMIYVGDGKVVEAVGQGVRELPLEQALHDAILAVAYRVPGLDAAASARVVAHARSRIGSPYNAVGAAFQGYRILNPLPAAVISAVGNLLHVEPGQAGAVYCSELVLESFERGGRPLGSRPSQSTPDGVVQLARSRWSYVGHLVAEDVPMGIQLGMDIADYDTAAQALAATAPVSLPAPPADLIQQPLQADEPETPVAQAQAAPVLIPIAAAVIGAAFTRLLSNTGDVYWELDQMSGLKHPNDAVPSPLPAFQDGAVVRLVDWPSVENGLRDVISAGFEVRWQHNGQSLGNVQISNVATNDAVGWGLKVKAQIMNDSIVYPRNAPRFAALRIRFDYQFTRSIGSDLLAWRELHLFGNGSYNLTGDWTQQ